MSSGIFAPVRPYDGAKGGGGMKTIAACALLAALAFGLLPGKDWNLESEDDGLVLLVETDALQEAARAVSGAADAPEPSLDSRTVRLLVGQDVLKLSMEDYLTGVLLSEMPVDFSPEARKAQVVAARTFTCRKLQTPKHESADVCADFACCQAWTSRRDLERKYGDDFTAVWQSAQELVRESSGEVLTFGGELIDAVYFSCSGGATEAAVAVWGTDVPYLQSVESPGEEIAPRFSSQEIFAPAEFSGILRAENPDVHLTGSPETWVGETAYTEGGSVATCIIGGIAFSGTKLRQLFGLNSARFTLTLKDGQFVFDVQGFGHRVGMSQYGAESMARLGFSYRTILLYYYQGAEIEQERA